MQQPASRGRACGKYSHTPHAVLMSLFDASLAVQECGGTLEETAAAIDAAGGKGVAVACDHADDEQAIKHVAYYFLFCKISFAEFFIYP